LPEGKTAFMRIKEFQQRVKLNGGCDRKFGKWLIIDVHRIPEFFLDTDEVDFYCCNDSKVYLLRLRSRTKEMFDVIPCKNGMIYLVAELPIHSIDNAFIENVLLKFNLE
jgi:hypothetical protein